MTRDARRFTGYAAALGAAVAAFGLVDAPFLRAAAALGGLVVVAAHAATADEVERALTLRAAATAFGLVAAAAVAVAVLGGREWASGAAEWVWAFMFGLYLASWSVWRVVRG